MIIFSNKSALDIRAVTTFGLSVKDENAIGRFGTGLKYAIAIVMRSGGTITIRAGGDEYTFEATPDEFRGVEKNFIYMRKNGGDAAQVGFTTDLGRDWENWQAFREFYANCKDESGSLAHSEEMPEATSGTQIIVDFRPFEAMFYSLEEFFIGPDEEPIWENDAIAVYPGRTKNIFYRGIRVQELKTVAAFRYNIKNYLSLTEDRTARYSWEAPDRITSNLPLCDNETICAKIMERESEFEQSLKYAEEFKGTPSAKFAAAVVASPGKAPIAAAQLVRMSLPADASKYSVGAPSQKGMKELARAVALAVKIGLDKNDIQFVIGIGLPVAGEYAIRGRNLIFAEKILEDQDAMNLAAVCGIAELSSKVPRKHLASLLINKTLAEAAE